MPGMIWGDYDYARLEYYVKNGVIPPPLTKLDQKAYKLHSKVRREIVKGSDRELRGLTNYALMRYNRAVMDYQIYVGFLRSNGFNGCNYYWDEDTFVTHIEYVPWRKENEIKRPDPISAVWRSG